MDAGTDDWRTRVVEGTNPLTEMDLDGIVTNVSMLSSPVAAQAA